MAFTTVVCPFGLSIGGLKLRGTAKCTMPYYPSPVVVFVLWLAGLGAAAQFAKIVLVLPELAQMYPSAGVTLGLLVSSVSFVGAFLGLFAGSLAVKIGFQKLLIVGLALGSLVSLLQSIGLPISLLLASRVIEGFAHLAIVVAAPTLIALHSSDQMRSAAMTLWGSFFGVSIALTAWLGLPIVAKYGVNTLFFTHGVLMALTLLLIIWVVPAQKTEAAKGVIGPLNLSSIVQLHKQAWSSPTISAPATGWLFYTFTFVALLTVIPSLAPPEDRNLIATALPLASILTSMTLGVLLLQWLSAVVVVQMGLVAAIFASLLVLFASGSAWPAVILFGALGLTQGASFAAVPQLNPSSEHQALANGTLAQAGNLGNSLGTPIVLLALAVGGLKTVIFLVILCYLVAISAHSILAKRRKINPRS